MESGPDSLLRNEKGKGKRREKAVKGREKKNGRKEENDDQKEGNVVSHKKDKKSFFAKKRKEEEVEEEEEDRTGSFLSGFFSRLRLRRKSQSKLQKEKR